MSQPQNKHRQMNFHLWVLNSSEPSGSWPPCLLLAQNSTLPLNSAVLYPFLQSWSLSNATVVSYTNYTIWIMWICTGSLSVSLTGFCWDPWRPSTSDDPLSPTAQVGRGKTFRMGDHFCGEASHISSTEGSSNLQASHGRTEVTSRALEWDRLLFCRSSLLLWPSRVEALGGGHQLPCGNSWQMSWRRSHFPISLRWSLSWDRMAIQELASQECLDSVVSRSPISHWKHVFCSVAMWSTFSGSEKKKKKDDGLTGL